MAKHTEIIAKKPTDKDDTEEELKNFNVGNLKGVSGFPDFWWRTIRNKQMIRELVKEKNEAILAHLRRIDTEREAKIPGQADSRKSLKVNFHFNDNEFFSDKVLSLKVIYRPDAEDEVEKIEGTPIAWADETKVPTKKKIKKKQKHKKTNETRTIVKIVKLIVSSMYSNCVAPEEGAQLDEEEKNKLRDKIDMAMKLAKDVDDTLEYYLGLNKDMKDKSKSGFDTSSRS